MSAIRAWWAGLSDNGRRGVVGGGIAALAVLLIGAAVALGGGGSEEQAAPKPKPKPTTTTTTAVVTTTTEPPTGPVAPLTGLRVKDGALLARPVLAVKVDNLDTPRETAVPQTGLIRADVVYEEVVEGNITRLVGVFHSQQPETVGPVRSARTTDVILLPQFGKVLLAWSGGNEGVTAAVHASPSIIDVGANAMPGSFHRDNSRRAPHNLYVDGNSLWQRAPAGTPAPHQMFFFRKSGQSSPNPSRKAAGVDLTWGGGGASSPVSWRWDQKARLYVRSQNGRIHKDSSGTPLTAKNVVVQVTEYGQSPADLRSPEAHTVGSGELYVFTNGRVVHGTWSRGNQDQYPTLLDDQGKVILLSPGQTWIELPKAGGVHPRGVR
ncbi:MAG: DUF3048 domain-containing protein [Acidimicrobiales bacterium]